MKNAFSKTHLQGVVAILLSSGLFSFFALFTRIMGDNISVFYSSWTRGVFSSIILALLVTYFGAWKKVSREGLIWMIGRGLFGAVAYYCFYTAINALTVGSAYLLFYGLTTIGGYVLGRVIFSEKFTLPRVIALIIVLTGLSMIYSFSLDPEKLFFAILALLSGLLNSFWVVLPKKLERSYPIILINFADMIVYTIAYFFVSLISHEAWVLPTLSAPWIANLLLGIMFICTGQLIVFGFSKVPAQIGTLLMLSEIVFALIIGFLIFGEAVTLMTGLGALLIIVGIAIPEVYALKVRTSS